MPEVLEIDERHSNQAENGQYQVESGKLVHSSFLLFSIILLFVAPVLANSGEINLEAGPELPQLSTEELAVWMKEGKPVVLVDARGPESYAQAHLPRAINIPADQVEGLSAQLSKEMPIVVYCGGPGCPHARIVGQWLVTHGWKNVQHYPFGLPGWQQAGHPVEGAGMPVTQGGA